MKNKWYVTQVVQKNNQAMQLRYYTDLTVNISDEVSNEKETVK